MANSEWSQPVFPRIPDHYDPAYMRAIVSQLQQALYLMAANGNLRCGTLNISNLPTSATGLRTGDLWNDSGTVKVV